MASKANITMDQGSTFSTDIYLVDDNNNPLDLTGYTGTSKMKKSYASNSATTFTVNVVNGMVTLFLNSNTTTNLTPGKYVYDVVLSSNAASVRILEGIVTVAPGVTT